MKENDCLNNRQKPNVDSCYVRKIDSIDVILKSIINKIVKQKYFVSLFFIIITQKRTPVTAQQHRRPLLEASQVARRSVNLTSQRMHPWQRRAVQNQVRCVPQSDFRCVKPHVHLAVTARLFYSHMHKCDVTLAKCCQYNTYRVK